MKKTLFLAAFIVTAGSLSADREFWNHVRDTAEHNSRYEAALQIKDEKKFKKEAKAIAEAFEKNAPNMDRFGAQELVVSKEDCGKDSWVGFPYESILTSLWKWAQNK